jgi:hypothetical protein
MQTLEEEVKLIRAYWEDEVMDEKVGEITPDLGCSKNRGIKFHQTVELYWNTKT